MSKNRGYREYAAPVDEAIPAETKEEVVAEINAHDETQSTVEENDKTPLVTAVYGKVVNCYKLNIRKKPSQDSESLRVIDVNDSVEILNESTTDGWLSVLLSDGTKGYTMKDYIKVIN